MNVVGLNCETVVEVEGGEPLSEVEVEVVVVNHCQRWRGGGGGFQPLSEVERWRWWYVFFKKAFQLVQTSCVCICVELVNCICSSNFTFPF